MFQVGDYIQDIDDRNHSPIFGTVARIHDGVIFYTVDTVRTHAYWVQFWDDKRTDYFEIQTHHAKQAIRPDIAEDAAYYEAVTEVF